MLRYGIPEYRLPKERVLDPEYESITRLGGRFVCNQALGRDVSLDDLQNQGYDAVLVAIGCYDTNKLGIPGEAADGVIDGLEYLKIATLGLPYPGHAGTRVVVIGGGFTSMDCSRTSVRQGASEVTATRYGVGSMPAAELRPSYVEYEIPYTPSEAIAESTRCLQCTCEAIGFCDLRRLGIEYGTTLKTLEPQNNRGAGFRSVTENRFTGSNHDYIRDDSHAFILREPSRCIDCGRCANVCAEVVEAACYDFMRIGFDTLVTTPLDMSLNDTPCVSCGRCAETCPTGALMPKPRILQKFEVNESTCILCGICVDACPYDALRCGPDFELAHVSREEPMIALIAIAAVDRETEMTYVRRERRG